MANRLYLFIFMSITLMSSACFTSHVSASEGVNSNDASSKAISHLSAKITVLQKQLTPGQQTSVVVDVKYSDGVDIYFEPSQFDWQPFTLLEHKKSQPYLITADENTTSFDWRVTYNIELIAPRAGTYQLENMTIQSYLGNQHSSQSIVFPAINITSSFNSTPELQGLEALEASQKVESNKPLLISLILVLIVIIVAFINRLKQKQLKQLQNQSNFANDSLISPQLLIDNANNKDNCDWQLLRQCMQRHLGFDPMAEQINIQNLALSNEYISSRFSTSNKQKFIEICQRCQSAKSKDIGNA